MMIVPQQIMDAIAESGLPFSFKEGGKHSKVMFEGRVVGTFCRNGRAKGDKEYQRIVSRIRRIARQKVGGGASYAAS